MFQRIDLVAAISFDPVQKDINVKGRWGNDAVYIFRIVYNEIFYCILCHGNCRPCTFYLNMQANIDSAVSLHNWVERNNK